MYTCTHVYVLPEALTQSGILKSNQISNLKLKVKMLTLALSLHAGY